MNDEPRLYNSRVIKIWLEYLRRHNPDIDLKSVLNNSGMDVQEIEDPGHWFTQSQTDRFYDTVRQHTGDPKIAQKTGRYVPFCDDLHYMNQFTLGFLSPKAVYLLMNKVAGHLSRGSEIKTRQIGQNKMELLAVPASGVAEKPYQCENRIGMLEAVPHFFKDALATVEHPECVHRGDAHCRYLVTWEPSTAAVWKRVRNYTVVIGYLALFLSLFTVPFGDWLIAALVYAVVTIVVWAYPLFQGNRKLVRALKDQSEQARSYMEEMNYQSSQALLIEEIGQAAANLLDEDGLIDSVVNAMRKRLHFDRGLIMLADKDRTRLVFSAGYGYDEKREKYIAQTTFNLTNPSSKGVFVKAFIQQEACLVEDFDDIAGNLSPRSLEFAQSIGTQSLICVPITFKKESLGVLAVDNRHSLRPLRKSDINLLSGIASQLAVGIVNARAIRRLVESEKKYRELVENVNSIILRRTPEGTITFLNEFAQRHFDYRAEDIIGRNFFGAIIPDTVEEREEFDALISTLLTEPDKHIVKETTSRLATGETIWIAWTHRPVLSEDGSVLEILCIGTDITQLRKSEIERKELEASLIRAHKMEALGTLAGGVAHDLNNVLAGLVSYPDLLMLQLPEDSPLRDNIATIKRSGEKAAAIVQDLLTLARRGVAEALAVNLNDIIGEYVKSPEFKALEDRFPTVAFKIDTDPALRNISGSAVHLSKTMMNLVANAAEATEKGGTVRIRTQNRFVDTPVSGYDHVEKGDYCVVEVSDTGIGIPPEDLNRIFEPFYSKKKMGHSGTGLGMAVVWGSIKDHSGYIDVESQVGAGTVFTLYFPVTRKPLSAIRADAERSAALRGHGESILVVDDMADQREVAKNMMECLGYKVTTVDSGLSAIEYLRNNNADLMVLDMIMDPGIDGLETFQRCLKIHPGQKAIIVSGFSETNKVRDAKRLGAGAYVKKPYSLETIGAAIREALIHPPRNDRLPDTKMDFGN